MTPTSRTLLRLTLLALFTSVRALGQTTSGGEHPIQDNSFLVEEAYNQERGVIQHISTLTRLWNSKDWSYTFTEEFPTPRHWRHQLSYTLVAAHSGAFTGTGGGWGDVMLNYRYQVIGDGDARVAFAPRLSVLLPAGDVTQGRGFGSAGVQTNLPVSVALHRRIVMHFNIGGTYVPKAQDFDHCRANSLGYTVGQSTVYLFRPRLNFLLEVADNRSQSVIENHKTEWARVTYISPGIRWAYNFKSGLQIVPGVGIPLGVGATAHEKGIFLYLSFEHPVGHPPEITGPTRSPHDP